MGLLDTPEQSSDIYIAADAHNVANGNGSFWQDIPAFVGLGLASGLNQVYNIVPTVGNWFGADLEQNNLADTLAGFDSDIANYYSERQEGIDTLGFVLSSFVPGMAGVKVLRAGQASIKAAAETGNVGKSLSRVTGLLTTNRAKHVKEATDQLINTGSPFSLQNQSVLKALRSGFGQAAMETAAFEGAVAATMYNSPVLEEQSVRDLTTNLLFAGTVGTALGGVVDGVRAVSQIKQGVRAFDNVSSPWTFIDKGQEITSPADKIVLFNHQRFSMPSVLPGVDNAEKLLALGRTKKANLELMIREQFQEIAGGDSDLADLLTKDFLSKDADTSINNVWQLQGATRLTAQSREETVKRLLGKGDNAALKAELEEVSTGYLRFYGDKAGELLEEAPSTVYLGDTLKKGAQIDFVNAGVKVNGKLHKITPQDKWDFFKASENEIEMRLAWARQTLKEVPGEPIAHTDIPMLDAAYAKGLLPKIKVGDATWQPATQEEFLGALRQYKMELAKQLAAKKVPTSKIAKLVNTTEDWLLGGITKSGDEFADIKYLSQYQALTGDTKATTLLGKPSTVKLDYRAQAIDENEVNGLEAILRQQELYKQSSERTAAHILGEQGEMLPEVSMEAIMKADRMGAGASLLTFASSNYGTLGSAFEYVGNLVTNMIRKQKDSTASVLQPLLYKLRNNQAAAIEWSTLTQKVRGSEHTWYLNDAGDGLTARVKDVEDILFKSKDVAELAKANIELNGARVGKLQAIRAAQGLEDTKQADAFYTPPPNPKHYPFFAFVIDPTVTGTGHSKMLYAATENELKAQIAAVQKQFPEFKVLQKGEAEQYYKAIGAFEYEKTLSDNYIDTALRRKGVSERFLPLTDSKVISDELLEWHLRAESGVIREAVSLKYEAAFASLRQLGEQYTLAATSRFGGKSLAKYAESGVQNPYTDYIKVALGINTANEYPFWMPVQRMFEDKVSSLFSSIKNTFAGNQTLKGLEDVNKQLHDAGYKGAYYDAAMAAAVNTGLPAGALSSYVQHSNAALAFFALRSDPLNALNNVIGNNVLLNTELASLLRNIEKANPGAAGELAALAKLKVPGTDKEILSHTKLIARAIHAFHSRNEGALQFFTDAGFITNIRQQYMGSLDDLALRSTDTLADLNTRSAKALELTKRIAAGAEKWTGNSLAEEFNRFVSAHVMKDITDLAVKHGVMPAKNALPYINSFVNRTQGNFLAAQRPMLFQGPIGQAIGLFQTYQFNLIQQLLRHVAEGTSKDTAMLLGLQGSIFGINGLPAFNAINTHIIGTAAGNTDNKDIPYAVYQGSSKDAGDWLMYGLASNMFLHPDLKLNMYTRGDINPRHVTIVPTNPADVPFINAQAKFFGNMFETLGRMDNTGNVANIFLQGLQNNGLSRPLAGLAQVMQAATNPEGQALNISKQGNIIGSNDLVSLSTLGRLAGGKPLDEAIVQDTTFRMKAYAATKAKRIASLGEDIKSTLFAGDTPTQEQIEQFATKYVELGGKQEKFNQFFMRQYVNATKSQAEQMAATLSKPYAKGLQEIMGGQVPQDDE